MNKFREGQTVYSPFGLVKIIACWRTSYDVKFVKIRDKVPCTETWTFEEHELSPFTWGGVAIQQDDAVKLINVDENLVATFSVWMKVNVEGKVYSFEKEFKEQL